MNIQNLITPHIKDDAGCKVWMRGCSNNHPCIRHDGKQQLVRRLLWTELHGSIPAGKIVRMTCETPRCVNPEHMAVMTMQKLTKQLGALGLMSSVVRSAKIAAVKRRTHGKLTIDAVRDIRTSTETGVNLAIKYGVGECKISEVRRHKVWREYTTPWSGL